MGVWGSLGYLPGYVGKIIEPTTNHQHPTASPASNSPLGRSLYRASVTAAVALQDDTFSKALKAEAETCHPIEQRKQDPDMTFHEILIGS